MQMLRKQAAKHYSERGAGTPPFQNFKTEGLFRLHIPWQFHLDNSNMKFFFAAQDCKIALVQWQYY